MHALRIAHVRLLAWVVVMMASVFTGTGVLAASATAAAPAAAVPDQLTASYTGDGFPAYSASVLSGQELRQTFTATATGQLTRASVWVRPVFAGTSVPAQVGVYALNPDGSLGAQIEMVGAQVTDPTFPPNTDLATFGNTNTLVAGERYALIVRPASQIYAEMVAGSYSGGKTYVDTVGDPFGAPKYGSAWFKVYVSLPPKSDQTITFDPLTDKTFGDPDFDVSATASSGLPVSFTATGDCTVSGATVHLTGAGSCTITASQPGNDSWNPAPDVSRTFTVGQATPTVTLKSSANPSAYGDAVHFAVQVSSTAGTPTGTVQFFIDGVDFGSPVTLDGSGRAVSVDTTHLVLGSSIVHAVYSGDTNFAGEASPFLIQKVVKATPTVTLTSSANPSGYKDAVRFTAQVSSSAGTPPGSVQFRIDGVAFGTPVTLDSSGQAVSADISSLNAGNHNIRAAYLGSGNYAAASSPILVQTVTKATPTVTLTSSANPSGYKDAVHFTAQVSSSVGTPAGTVQFRVDGVNVGAPVTLDGSGQAVSADISSLNAGSHNIRAAYQGSTNYTAASSLVLVQKVTKATPTVTLTSSANPSGYGDPVRFTAQVSSSVGTPTGTVQFRVDGVNVGSPVALDSSGQAVSADMSSLNAGSRNVRAVYQGSTNYTTAASPILTQTVTKAAPTITLTSSANPSVYEEPVRFTAEVASSAGTPTGNVQFRIDGVNVGSPVALDRSGQAVSPRMTPAPGDHNVRAVYQGSANYTPVTSDVLVQKVNRVVASAG